MEYAVVAKLKLQPVDGAKTLQMAFYEGMPFAVSKDFEEDGLYVIFLPDGQISEDYAQQHDLIRRKDPETGEYVGGFFGKNRKVRSINLMKGKIRSVGYVASLESLEFTGFDISKLKEGDSFNELNGVPICNKFINRATRNAQGKSSGFKPKKEAIGLKMHPDTKMVYREKRAILPGDLVTITEKLDGTSVRFGEAYIPKEYGWFFRFIGKFISLQKQFNEFVYATRRVIQDPVHGKKLYRDNAEKTKGMLSPGESVYGEIVGWETPENLLFVRGGVEFKYGCPNGESDLYVYSMKWTLPNGNDITLPWEAVKQRCKEMNIKTVPEIIPPFIWTENHNYNDYESLIRGPSVLDNSHIKEGIVFRIDRGMETFFLKWKSEEFYALEDKFKANEDNVDIEEAS
jgi:hypothetical protein